MGLKDAFRNAAKAAVQAFGDVPASVTYYARTTVEYVASTGSTNTVYAQHDGVQVIFAEFSIRQVDGQIVRPGDKLAYIANAGEFSGIKPTVDDYIAEGDERWFVQAVRTDPADALWNLHVRKA